jgi:hypothetical protein
MYNVAFTGSAVVAIVKFVELDQTSIIVLRAVAVLWGSFFSSLAFVLPRWIEVRKNAILANTLPGRTESSFNISSRARSYFDRSRSRESTSNKTASTETKTIPNDNNQLISSMKTSEGINNDPRNTTTNLPSAKLLNIKAEGERRDSEIMAVSILQTWDTMTEVSTAEIPRD